MGLDTDRKMLHGCHSRHKMRLHLDVVALEQWRQQRHCGVCRRKWWLTDTDMCPCGETQTMSHIVESCPDKTEWLRLISATLCGRIRCFVADQLWFMTRIREEEEEMEARRTVCLVIHSCQFNVKLCKACTTATKFWTYYATNQHYQ